MAIGGIGGVMLAGCQFYFACRKRARQLFKQAIDSRSPPAPPAAPLDNIGRTVAKPDNDVAPNVPSPTCWCKRWSPYY
ncbi:hypothetical protein KCP76_00455 [Salmonella enterica subsp. enterica serovar Weltevreden]|nr:hypothetical protein KCP76_00455 [Salmonella enterica subsp. enterica serovar Weltevreden]